jgi:uncharacterized protein YndB with AHSA1/START domain
MTGDEARADLWPSIERAEQALGEFGVVTAARTIRFQRLLPGPIERVWAYLTESDKRGRWLASGDMDLRVGGRVELRYNHAELATQVERPPEKYRRLEQGFTTYGRITGCEPPRRLSFTWQGEGEDASEVTFELSPRDDQVLLVLTHRRIGARSSMISLGGGWHVHLAILGADLAGRAPPPFWSTHARLEAEYDRRLPPE